MPHELIVSDESIVLTGDRAGRFADRLSEITVNSIQDAVEAGLLRNEAVASSLLNAAKEATAVVLRSPLQPITGTPGRLQFPGGRLPDMKRYSSFLARSGDATPAERTVFWK